MIAKLMFFLWASVNAYSNDPMPLPWTRELSLASPAMTGNDVLIMCTLLQRDFAVADASSGLPCDSIFDQRDYNDVVTFQKVQNLEVTGVFCSYTAQRLLDCCSADNYKDNGFTAASMGYKYKLNIPVHKNRSIETTGTLFDANNKVLLKFPVRTHGHREDCSNNACAWPDFGNGDFGLNEFTSNGNTVTGLIEIDLNSAEPDPDLYGPWPVNRYVRGLEGNALLLLPNIRDGILLHTGNWSIESQVLTQTSHNLTQALTQTSTPLQPWRPNLSMPNSAG